MCIGVLPACVSVWGHQIPQELELQTVVSCHVGSTKWTQVLWKTEPSLQPTVAASHQLSKEPGYCSQSWVKKIIRHMVCRTLYPVGQLFTPFIVVFAASLSLMKSCLSNVFAAILNNFCQTQCHGASRLILSLCLSDLSLNFCCCFWDSFFFFSFF